MRTSYGERRPLTKARSPWEQLDDHPIAGVMRSAGVEHFEAWLRRVGDGELQVIVTRNPPGPEAGWHLSISFSDHRGRGSRYPRWDEIADARYEFCPSDITMCMVLPPPDEYISLHDTTFQLHEHRPA
jgi:hypothetical protein